MPFTNLDRLARQREDFTTRLSERDVTIHPKLGLLYQRQPEETRVFLSLIQPIANGGTKMPKKIGTWFVALFFLLAGLAAFGLAFPFMNYLEGIFGILAAIFTFLDK